MAEPSTAAGKVIAVRGPVIVTTELAPQLRLFVDALGHRVVADESLSAAQVAAGFGRRDRRARAVLRETASSSSAGAPT